jgi:hypothetical protein
MNEWLRKNDDVLFLATQDDDRRSLVFLNDEFQTGTGFPRGIEALVDEAIEQARTKRSTTR